MTKNLNPQITAILENSQTTEDAISSLDSLITEHKEFLEVRIKSFGVFILPLLSMSLPPALWFAVSTIASINTRREYNKIFKDIYNSDNKIDFIYEHDGLNTLKSILLPTAIAAFYKISSLTLQAVQYFAHNPKLLEEASQALKCLQSIEPSDNIIELCGNDGSYYISGEL